MLRGLLFLILVATLYSCNFPDSMPVLPTSKKADSASRACIDALVQGRPDASIGMLDTSIVTDTARQLFAEFSKDLSTTRVKNIRTLEAIFNTGIITGSEQFTTHQLSYEYEFDKKNILFQIAAEEKHNSITITSLHWTYLSAPVKTLTAFSFADKPAINYIWFTLALAVPLFIVFTFVAMLRTSMPGKKKWLWGVLILFLSVSKFMMNWNTGQTDFQIISINLLGASLTKPNLYSFWVLGFSIPLGAILFWIKRRGLMTKPNEAEEPFSFDTVPQNTSE